MATSADELLEAAINYAEMGYPVFPCKVGLKEPACAHGFKDATTDIQQIEQWWSTEPYNIGLATQGLLVVDIDGEGNPWLRSLGERVEDLMGCPAAITPRGGMHLYFLQPESTAFRNTTDHLAPAVDTRANGGYVIAPPSNLEGGGGYRWIPERELERFLPNPPEWLVDRLNGQKSESSTRAERPEVNSEPINEGGRNATLTSQAGRMRRIGMEFPAIEAALQSINCDRCNPPLDPSEVRTIAYSVSKYAAHETDDHHHEPPKEQEPFPQELLYPPGFLSEVMDYNLDGAFREQPILALAGAISLLSVLTGRKVRDASGTRSNLMILGVAASGSGKERARQVNKEILFRAGGTKLIGPESPASGTGIVSAINVQPALLFQWDEMGRLLKSISGSKASPHLAAISTVMMKLFTASGSVYLGDAYADATRNVSINQPHSVLYGTTVPQNLYENLTSDSINDGFLSRMLIFESEDNAPPYKDPEIFDPPESILAFAKEWLEKSIGGNLSSENPDPMVMEISNKANGVFREFRDYCLSKEQDINDAYSNLWSRAGEKAKKLAIIHTCSRGKSQIDSEAVVWACRLSSHLTEKLSAVGRDWVAETQYQATCQRIYRWLVSKGGVASRSDLCRAMRHLTKAEREAAIEGLKETAGLTIETRKTKGRPSECFIIPTSLPLQNGKEV